MHHGQGPGTCDFYTQREKTSGKMIPCSCTNDEEDMKDEDFLMTRGGRADVVSIETRLINKGSTQIKFSV